jgi:hypothetical protein
MRRLLFAFVFALCSLRAVAQTPVVRAHLEPKSNILVGQSVRLVVSVFVPNYFTGGVDFPEFELENAIVVLPQDRPQNSNMQINGVTYAGITQTYVLYPQQTCDFHIPPAQLSVPYAIAPPKSTTATPSLPALTFHADVPAAAKDLPYFLPTTSLTMTQRWSRPLKGLRTGDTVERTITVTASKMQAMLIPPLPLDQPDGMHVYPAEPVVHDQKTDRGDFIYGRRMQSAKYLIQKAGDYTLPAIKLQWWNLITHRLVTATLPETKFTAITNPDYVAELPPPPEAIAAVPVAKISLWKRYHSRIRIVLELIAVGFALLIASWLSRPAWARLSLWLKQRKTSEAACFRRLLHAVRANDAKQTYAELVRWFGMIYPGLPLHAAVKASADAALGSEISRLAQTIYGRQAPARDKQESIKFAWNGAKLATHLRQLRRIHKASRGRVATESPLPSLNPSVPHRQVTL